MIKMQYSEVADLMGKEENFLMKKLIATLVILACWASPGFAVDIGERFGINGNVGILSPIGDLADQADTSTVFGAKVMFSLNKFVMLEGNAGYSSLSLKGDELNDLSILELTLGLRLFVFAEGRFFPYLNGALGLYKTSVESKLAEEDEEEANFGGNFGLGFMAFFTDHVSLDVQGRFHYFPERLTTFEDLDDNVFVTLTGGITYLF